MTHVPMSRPSRFPDLPRRRTAVAGAAVVAGVLAAAAGANLILARRAERRNPARGRLLEVDGVRLHCVEAGAGPVLVLVHGNGSMIGDFASSGLIARTARRHRVIAFDRPGFGHSARPRGRVWDAAAQARLIWAALDRLGVRQARVLGHSWGASVAVEMALARPEQVEGLVLVSGYYFPTPRIDMALMAGPAVPGLGDVGRWTVAPWLSRMIWPRVMRKLFGPAPVPSKFRLFPKEMALRPGQLRAAAEESGLMMPMASKLSRRYRELSMPVSVVAGEADRLVDARRQSGRLSRMLGQGRLTLVPGAGHMVHQTHTGAVLAAVEEMGVA